MNKPVLTVYTRVTRNGVRAGKTRKGQPMVTFTASAFVEERRPTTGRGEALTDPDENRRQPWWLRCVVVNPQYLPQAEALAPGDYAALMGRVERHRWKGADGHWRDYWTLFVDSLASFTPGRYPTRADTTDPENEAEADIAEAAAAAAAAETASAEAEATDAGAPGAPNAPDPEDVPETDGEDEDADLEAAGDDDPGPEPETDPAPAPEAEPAAASPAPAPGP